MTYLDGDRAVSEGWSEEGPIRWRVGEAKGMGKPVKRLRLEGWSQWPNFPAGVWEPSQDVLSNGFYLKDIGDSKFCFYVVFLLYMFDLQMSFLKKINLIANLFAHRTSSDFCGHGWWLLSLILDWVSGRQPLTPKPRISGGFSEGYRDIVMRMVGELRYR